MREGWLIRSRSLYTISMCNSMGNASGASLQSSVTHPMSVPELAKQREWYIIRLSWSACLFVKAEFARASKLVITKLYIIIRTVAANFLAVWNISPVRYLIRFTHLTTCSFPLWLTIWKTRHTATTDETKGYNRTNFSRERGQKRRTEAPYTSWKRTKSWDHCDAKS